MEESHHNFALSFENNKDPIAQSVIEKTETSYSGTEYTIIPDSIEWKLTLSLLVLSCPLRHLGTHFAIFRHNVSMIAPIRLHIAYAPPNLFIHFDKTVKGYGEPSPDTPSRSRYEYCLQLVTSCGQSRPNSDYQKQNNMSHVSVVMEGESDQFDWIQLSYCEQDCQRIPPALWKMYGTKVQYLDLSYNSIVTLKGLGQFARLEELILDNNELGDAADFPPLPHLKTLSLNNNQITDLEGLISKISGSFPALSYLSLLSNKACPNQLSDLDKDDSDYQRYRLFVIYKLPNLHFLDSRRVLPSERREAATRGEFMRVRRPARDVSHAPSEPALRPLPVDFAALGKHKGAYGKCLYKYTGKHSEGNRFIVNSDL